MTNRELKKLSRKDLLELMLSQQKMIEGLQEDLDKANETITEQKERIEQMSSLTQVTLRLSKIAAFLQKAIEDK